MATRVSQLVQVLERAISSEVERFLTALETELPRKGPLDADVIPVLRRVAVLVGALNEKSTARRTVALLLALRDRFDDLGQADEWAMAYSLLEPFAPAPAVAAYLSFAGEPGALSQPQLLEALALLSHRVGNEQRSNELVTEVKRREMERRLMLDLGAAACRASSHDTVLDVFDPQIAGVRRGGLLHSFVAAAPSWEPSEPPPPPAATVEDFASSLASLTDDLVAEVAGPHLAAGRVVVSGSAVLFCLRPWDAEPQPCRDVDLFLIGPGPYDGLLFDVKSRFLEAAARRDCRASIRVSGNALCLRCGTGLEVQVVLKAFPTVEHLLLAADLDCCSVAYDGTRVLCLPRFVLAQAAGANFLDATQRPLQIKRAVKYRERGYSAVLPVQLPVNFAQPLLYSSALTGLLYTARVVARGYTPLASTPWTGRDTGPGRAFDSTRRSDYDRPDKDFPAWETSEATADLALEEPHVAETRTVSLCGALHNSSLAELVRPPDGACGCPRCRPLALRPAPRADRLQVVATLAPGKPGLYESKRFEIGTATFTLTAMCCERRRVCVALTLRKGGPCAVGFQGGRTHALCTASPSVPLLRARRLWNRSSGTPYAVRSLEPAAAGRRLSAAEGRALRGDWRAPWAPAVHQAFSDAVRCQVRTLYLLAAQGRLCDHHVAAVIAFLLDVDAEHPDGTTDAPNDDANDPSDDPPMAHGAHEADADPHNDGDALAADEGPRPDDLDPDSDDDASDDESFDEDEAFLREYFGPDYGSNSASDSDPENDHQFELGVLAVAF